MNLKNAKHAILGSALLFLASGACADQFEGFKRHVNAGALKYFAKDMAGLLGSGSFHTGRNLGFPGVDVGLTVSGQTKPSEENTILKDIGGQRVDNIVIPMIHGEIGLPYNVDFILRGMAHQEIAVVGGGMRYGLFKANLIPLTPAISVSAFTHLLSHSYFTAAHVAGNVAVDLAVPFLNPYVGVGYDSARVKIRESDTPGIVGLTAKAGGVRGVAGINLKPLPLVYINGGYTFLHGESGYEAGLGIKF